MRTTGLLGSEARPPYAYIDVADPYQFGRDVASEAMTKIAAEFQAIADVVFLTTEPLTVDGAR